MRRGEGFAALLRMSLGPLGKRRSSGLLLVIFDEGTFQETLWTLQLLSAGGSLRGEVEGKLSPGADPYCRLGDRSEQEKGSVHGGPFPAWPFCRSHQQRPQLVLIRKVFGFLKFILFS